MGLDMLAAVDIQRPDFAPCREGGSTIFITLEPTNACYAANP